MLLYICQMCGHWEIIDALASSPSCPLCPEHEQMVSLSPGVQVSISKPDHDALSKTMALEALNRLHRYYGDRARIVAKKVKESVDYQSMAEGAMTASRWEAKQDAVKTVAKNLGVTLKQLAKEQEA